MAEEARTPIQCSSPRTADHDSFVQGALCSTRAVYESQGDLRSLRTKIVSVTSVDSLSEVDRKLFKQALPDDLVVTTEETIFHAQGGGQPSDTGCMVVQPEEGSQGVRFQVHAVRRDGNAIILHQGRLETGEPALGALPAGSVVEQIVDGDKRDLHSRCHSGGHLLGLAVRQLASEIPDVSETKAQHYPGAAFVEFRGKIEGKHRDSIQRMLDELVERDLPVTVSWLDYDGLKERRIHVPDGFARSPSAKGMRVVEIGDLGGYPCGGTHVHSTAKLGKVVVRKIASTKGNTKVSYEIE
jgi:Ser-tRNA(Ala) deacylase AlaX